MTITEQAVQIEAALADWVKTNQGRACIAADPLDALAQLRSRPGAPAAAVLFVDEQVCGGHPEFGLVLRAFKIVVSRGRSLKLVAGESLTSGAAGGGPLFDLVEQAREVARDLRMTDMDGEFQTPVYQGAGSFDVPGYLLDAFEIRFALYATLPRQFTQLATYPTPTPTE
jgi:hypothetical protein